MKLISGFKEVSWQHNRVTVTAIDPKAYPMETTVEVDETDTYHVIERDARYRPTIESPLSILTGAYQSIPAPPGSITAHAGVPFRIAAIIYDLDRTPICDGEWLNSAWREIFNLVGNTEIICSPLLGQRASTISTVERLQRLQHVVMTLDKGTEQMIYLLCNNRERRELGLFLGGK